VVELEMKIWRRNDVQFAVIVDVIAASTRSALCNPGILHPEATS
jgi:hypothetical protein